MKLTGVVAGAPGPNAEPLQVEPPLVLLCRLSVATYMIWSFDALMARGATKAVRESPTEPQYGSTCEEDPAPLVERKTCLASPDASMVLSLAGEMKQAAPSVPPRPGKVDQVEPLYTTTPLSCNPPTSILV